ncbi:MAG: tRNA pseudouridine(38-40) synthase TruA [Terrimicrobiaceae bacterium]
MRLKLTIAYDGMLFSGWQSQAHGKTVQDAVELSLRELCSENITVYGSGRTDAGVHALGQVAHADVPDDRFTIRGWLPALNAHLPAGVRVMSVKEAAPDFHARFSSRAKIYRYTVWNAPVMPPLYLNRAWHITGKLDLDLLKTVCDSLTGRHDFAAFSARRLKPGRSSIRTVSAIRSSKQGRKLTLTFEGEGFLYKMVRMLTASAIRCAGGRLDHEEILRRLKDVAPRSTYVAPAGGLCLVRVVY